MATEVVDLKRLKNLRRIYKAQLTKFNTFLNNDQIDVMQVKLRLLKFEPLLDQFIDVQSQIEAFDGDVSDASHDECGSFEDEYFNVLAIAKAVVEPSCARGDSASVESGGSRASVSSDANINIKLPPITLPVFDGNYEQWLFFRDTFESLVHNETHIPNINKFHYLRLSLRGGAADLLRSLEISACNYDLAWNMLVERYENKPMLRKNHIKALFECKAATKECHLELRNILDVMSRHLRALKVLGQPVDSWDALIIHMFAQKLDPVTRREWEGECAKHDEVSREKFSNFLQEKCRVLETLQTHNTKHKTNLRGLVTTRTPTCYLCNQNHTIYNCKTFLNLSAKDRFSEARRLKLCLNCLNNNHVSDRCRSMPCRKCQGKHNTLLHFNSNSGSSSESDSMNREIPVSGGQVGGSSALISSNNHSHQCDVVNSLFSDGDSVGAVLLPTALAYVSDDRGSVQSCRVLLDSGSESSFITESLCNKLNLKTKSIDSVVTGIGESSMKISKRAIIDVHARHTAFKVRINCLVLSKITNKIPSISINTEHLKIPPNLILADPLFDQPGPIDLLIGADRFWDLIMIGQVKLGKQLLTLQKTQLGWIVSGSLTSRTPKRLISCNTARLDDFLDTSLGRFWNIEEINSDKPISPENKICEQLFKSSTTRNSEGRFIVRLPLKQPVACLGDSRERALKCFLSLEKRLSKNPQLLSEYSKFLNEYESLGHMTLVSSSDLINKPCFFLPHHCVLKESSTTTKLRVVFNASAVTHSGFSLNDILHVGPTVQEDLFSIVLRSRKHNIMLTGDIEKMYRQVLVADDNRDLQLILWRPSLDSEIQTYRLNTVTYGTAPASFLSTRCLKEIALHCTESNPDISKIILKDFYVDDLCTGGSSIAEVKSIKDRMSIILKSYGFPLRKFVSNSPEVLSESPNNSGVCVMFGSEEDSKTLGLLWDSKSDTLNYSIKPFSSVCITKRQILSCISQIFDPLGLLQPVVIVGKMIIQKLWQCKLSWDESIPQDLHTTWARFQNQLPQLNNLKIPRHVLPQNCVRVELHGFSDASEMAYGACVYLRSTDSSGSHHSFLLCSKTRVAPLKTITIPRLELCAALLLAELMHKVENALDLLIDSRCYWCDSKIALAWIKSPPQQWKIFVANRVAQIQELTNASGWHYVNTSENPADFASRGLSPDALMQSHLWWRGPSWLKNSQEPWPVNPHMSSPSGIQGELTERRPERCITFLVSNNDSFDLINKFSSFSKLQRVTAYSLRFIGNCKKSIKDRKGGPLDTSELQNSLNQLVRLVQREAFQHEYHELSKSEQINSKSKLLSLNPFLDEHGIIRVGGRLRNSKFGFQKKHPAVLPGSHHFSKLLASHEHLRLLHAGPQLLLASIRDRFWPISGRSLVRKAVRNCLRCYRFDSNPTPYIMGNLPEHRVSACRPFNNIGVDFCGPFSLKDRSTRNYKATKAYICLCVCFSTRAIHLELVSDLTAEALIAALRRFFSRRGLCANIYSDCGTNFVGAQGEFKKFIKSAAHEVQSVLSQDNINWHFIPPRSPHFGGIWEAGVKSTKNHLKRVLNQTPLSYEEFLTVINQVEACLNSRPLFPYSNDPNDPQPLTPAHFLIGQRLTEIPDHNYEHIAEARLSKFQKLQQIIQSFWRRWSKEYISELQQRSKWRQNHQEVLKPGCMVIIKEDGLPPLKWKIGIVETIHPGSDGVTRTATIRTGSSTYRRPAVKLCVIPIEN